MQSSSCWGSLGPVQDMVNWHPALDEISVYGNRAYLLLPHWRHFDQLGRDVRRPLLALPLEVTWTICAVPSENILRFLVVFSCFWFPNVQVKSNTGMPPSVRRRLIFHPCLSYPRRCVSFHLNRIRLILQTMLTRWLFVTRYIISKGCFFSACYFT